MKSIEQAPMYLPEVEASPQPSPYADLIQVTQAAGSEYWQIWHLFAFLPEITSHMASFTEGVMRGPAPISTGLRELIAAYTSWTNECQFCWRSHAAVAAEMLETQLHASIPHASGKIHTLYKPDGSPFRATVTLPARLSGELLWKGRSFPLHSSAPDRVAAVNLSYSVRNTCIGWTDAARRAGK